MWYAILISFGLVLLLFLSTNPTAFHTKINTFAGSVDGVEELPRAETSAGALAAGADFHPPFWLFGTILVAPVVWTSLQWASYSVEQGGEIKNANVFRNQVFILVGSLVATAGLLVLMALRDAERRSGTGGGDQRTNQDERLVAEDVGVLDLAACSTECRRPTAGSVQDSARRRFWWSPKRQTAGRGCGSRCQSPGWCLPPEVLHGVHRSPRRC